MSCRLQGCDRAATEALSSRSPIIREVEAQSAVLNTSPINLYNGQGAAIALMSASPSASNQTRTATVALRSHSISAATAGGCCRLLA